jgi:signal transduction histidine kinase
VELVTGPPPLLRAAYGPDPAFLAVIAVAAALLAFVVAHTAGAPIRRLTHAASDVRPGTPLPELTETGPGDVRSAIRAFNDMQQRLSRHAAEQSYMIAAITHDLQTPMTRLRLKLEQIDDAALQKRLLADWQAMRAVVEEGLELVRSTGRNEEPVLLDIDSLINSIVEDEREAGHIATFDMAAACDWRCPRRCCAVAFRILSTMRSITGAGPISPHIVMPMVYALWCVIMAQASRRISLSLSLSRWSGWRVALTHHRRDRVGADDRT